MAVMLLRGRAVAALVGIVLLASAMVFVGPAASAPPVMGDDPCDTEEFPDAIRGTDGVDRLEGTDGDDLICGYGGDDVIEGHGGRDVVYGGDGDDQLIGGAGDDLLFGDDGDDVLTGSAGDDQLSGGDGADVLTGSEGDDALSGDGGDDRLVGSEGGDGLFGGDGDDVINGAAGDDEVHGGSGTDVVQGSSGVDACYGGEDTKGCELVADGPPEPAHHVIPESETPPGPSTVVLDGIVDGLRVEVRSSARQLSASDIFVRPSDAHMSGAGSLMAGPAFHIQVPGVPIDGATLTLPYDEAGLGDVPEADLSVWTFDEARQFWMPVEGGVVDPAANTVTVDVEHFSVYAVFKVRSADDWAEFFGDVPLLCSSEPGGNVAGFDVAFVIDTSGSMASNDPSDLRVLGAKQFLGAMGLTDRAAVVGFSSTATTYAALTSLDTADGRASVADALDLTAIDSGGTSISAAVARTIEVLSAGGGPDRSRVAILLTDGVSSYNTALTAQAAEAGISIHTVGFGASVNDALLQGIADGTGATYRKLTTADELPELYEELAGDIVLGGDEDGDGLKDCEERNGMFTPVRILLPLVFGGYELTGGAFTTTDPDEPDSDFDDIDDGEELIRHSIEDDAELAAAYPFLLEGGVTSYFTMASDPNESDSDDDGLDDGIEITECAPGDEPGRDCDGWAFPLGTTDPLDPDTDDDGAGDGLEWLNGTSGNVPDRWWYAAGLDLPPFTMVQPHRYGTQPSPSSAWLRVDADNDGERDPIRWYRFRNEPVTYDGDDLCVSNCEKVDLAVELRGGTDNGSGICVGGWFGSCLSEEDQEQRVIKEARLWLGVFDGDGFLTEAFQTDQTLAGCVVYHDPDSDCMADDIADRIEDLNDDIDVTPVLAGAVSATALQRTLPDGRINVPQAVVDAIAIELASRLIGGAEARPDDDSVEEMTRLCTAGTAWLVTGFIDGLHPCEILPIFAPGRDVQEAAQHKADALLANPEWVELTYQSEAEVLDRGVSRDWYANTSQCNAAAKAAAQAARPGIPLGCDEFPYYSTAFSGPGASLRFIRSDHNRSEGQWLGAFYNNGRCAPKVKVARVPYLVVPMPADEAPATMYVC